MPLVFSGHLLETMLEAELTIHACPGWRCCQQHPQCRRNMDLCKGRDSEPNSSLHKHSCSLLANVKILTVPLPDILFPPMKLTGHDHVKSGINMVGLRKRGFPSKILLNLSFKKGNAISAVLKSRARSFKVD